MLMKILLFLIHHQINHAAQVQRQQQPVEIIAVKQAQIQYLNQAQRHHRKRTPIQLFKPYHRMVHLKRPKIVRITFRIVVAAAKPVPTILYQR